jgi:glucosamine-phosphate N-acetyltransferase
MIQCNIPLMHCSMNNLATNGRIEDIAVARDQKGKRMGLRLLEALVHISNGAGCLKTVVNCSEANEAFHAQLGFVKEGTVMTLHHGEVGGRRGEPLS